MVGRAKAGFVAGPIVLALVVAVALSVGGAWSYASEGVSLGSEIDRIPTREKVVALTFDDAWDDASLVSILDTLKAEGVRATFFPTGIGVESSPDLARRIAAEGHEFGSHAYTHSKMRAMTSDELVSTLQKTEEAFSAAGLSDPSPLFRAPWGEVDSKVLEVLGQEGYAHIAWTARGGDNVANRSAAQVVVYIMADVRPGAIVVMHTNNDVTPKALPELIHRLKAKGYSFVTLGEALFTGEQTLRRYQQTSPFVTYMGEWLEQDSLLESGGSLYETDDAGAMAVVSFSGTSFELLAQTGPDRGKVSVVIDGGVPEQVDLYSEAEDHRVTVFADAELAEGQHIALISCSGDKNLVSHGGSIDIDAVRVAGELTAVPVVPVFTRGWDILGLIIPDLPF